jgi:mxaL protein
MSAARRLLSGIGRGIRHGICRKRGWLLGAAAGLLVIAAMLPPLPMRRTVVNHLVVFDITQSMYVADQNVDGHAGSRLAFARQALAAALKRLPCGSQIGLGIFASRRTLLLLAPVEVCANRVELDQAIAQIDARMAWENASEIARGVYSATDVAFELAQHPSVIFLTDGQEAPPRAVIPEFDRPPGRVKGMLVGVGGDTPQPIPRLDREGRQIGWWKAAAVVQRPTPAGFSRDQEHLSSIHERYLQALAPVAGLGYARLTDNAALEKILTDPRLARSLVAPTDLRWIPALLAAALLAAYYLRMPQLPSTLRQFLRLRRARLPRF